MIDAVLIGLCGALILLVLMYIVVNLDHIKWEVKLQHEFNQWTRDLVRKDIQDHEYTISLKDIEIERLQGLIDRSVSILDGNDDTPES